MPGDKNLATNEELRFEIAKKIFDYVGKNITKKTYSDEQIKKVINNKEKLELFEISKDLIDNAKKRNAQIDELKEELVNEYGEKAFNKVSLKAYARHFHTMIKPIPKDADEMEIAEIKQYNKDLYMDYANPANEKKHLAEFVDRIKDRDYMFSDGKTDRELIEYYKNNQNYVDEGFVILSASRFSSYDYNPEVQEILNKFAPVFESTAVSKATTLKNASAMNFLLPDDIPMDCLKDGKFQKDMASIVKEYVDAGVEGFEIDPRSNTETTMLNIFICEMDKENNKIKDQKVAADMARPGYDRSKPFFKNFKVEGKSYLEATKVEFNTPEEIQAIDDAFANKKFIYSSMKFKSHVEAKKYMDDFAKNKGEYGKSSKNLLNSECTKNDTPALIALYVMGVNKESHRGFFKFLNPYHHRDVRIMKNIKAKLDKLDVTDKTLDKYVEVLKEGSNYDVNKLSAVSYHGIKEKTEEDYAAEKLFTDYAASKNREIVDIDDVEITDDMSELEKQMVRDNLNVARDDISKENLGL